MLCILNSNATGQQCRVCLCCTRPTANSSLFYPMSPTPPQEWDFRKLTWIFVRTLSYMLFVLFATRWMTGVTTSYPTDFIVNSCLSNFRLTRVFDFIVFIIVWFQFSFFYILIFVYNKLLVETHASHESPASSQYFWTWRFPCTGAHGLDANSHSLIIVTTLTE